MNKLILILLLLISQSAKSQDGVFLSTEDFLENIVFHPSNSIIKERFATVIIKDDSCKKAYSHQNAFGYRYKGKQWRFDEGRAYEIVATEGIWVYRVENLTDLNSYSYFFSDGAYGEVLALSRANLRKCFSNQPEFLSIIKKIDWRMDLFQLTNYKNLPFVSALYQQLVSQKSLTW